MLNQTLRILSGDDVKRSLSMKQTIELMKDAFVRLSRKQANVPLRTPIEIPENNGGALFMPVYLPNTKQFGLKVASIFKKNPEHGLPLIHAMVLVMDATNGRPLALMDGEYLTALRTGAATGLATDLLARKDAEVVAIFGAGAQGRTQLEAVCAVRAIKQAFIFNPTSQKAGEFAHEMGDQLSIQVLVAKSIDVLSQADIVCTATTSSSPVFSNNDLKPGVHINAIGSDKPNMREIPAETVLSAKVVVDQREACLSEAGDLIMSMQEGLINKDHIYAEIGEIAAGNKNGRESAKEITLFKSVGNAVQDLAAASQVLVNARKLNLGTEIIDY